MNPAWRKFHLCRLSQRASWVSYLTTDPVNIKRGGTLPLDPVAKVIIPFVVYVQTINNTQYRIYTIYNYILSSDASSPIERHMSSLWKVSLNLGRMRTKMLAKFPGQCKFTLEVTKPCLLDQTLMKNAPRPFVVCRSKVKAVIWCKNGVDFPTISILRWVDGLLRKQIWFKTCLSFMANPSILKICSTPFQKLQGLWMLSRIAFWVSCRHHKCHEIRSLGWPPCVSVLKTLKYWGKWVSDAEIECIVFSSSVSSPHTIKTFSVSTSKRFYFCSHITPLTQSSSSTPTQLESLSENWVELEKS